MRGFRNVAAAMTAFLCCAASGPAIAQTSGQTLDDAGLKAMLDCLGYDSAPLSKGLLVTYKEDTWTLYVQVVLSSDGTKLGLNANLGLVDDLSTVSAEKWLGLLEANSRIDPSTFYVDADSRKLYLHRVIDNRGITPAVLRVQFENFVGNIEDNEDVWNLTK